MQKYYVTQNGNSVGPWAVDEIVGHLKKNTLAWTDYIYDEQKKDWLLLMDHPSFTTFFREMADAKSKPKSAPAEVKKTEKSPEPNREKEWFILKGDNKYGPFSYLDVVKMLQEKNLFEYDFAWNNRLENWKQISDCDEFQPEKVRALKESGHPEVQEVFFRRRHARARYGASIVVHNNKSVWRAESIEISPGGCGIVIENKDFVPGQTMFLHFQAGDGVPPFNAICQVVSKQSPEPGERRVRYGVKFTSISRQVQDAIKNFTTKAA